MKGDAINNKTPSITRMEISYRSVLPCNVKPKIFTSGSYFITTGDMQELEFDFLDSRANAEVEDGYLYIYVQQKDLCSYSGLPLSKVSNYLRQARKEDFNEINYECFADLEETQPIELEPLEVRFYDFNSSGMGEPIVIAGDDFSALKSA